MFITQKTFSFVSKRPFVLARKGMKHIRQQLKTPKTAPGFLFVCVCPGV